MLTCVQRLNDLLQTSDIDVLEAALQLDLRFAQQYRRTDRVAEDRLLQLAQGWQVRGGRGLDVLRLADPSYEPDIPSGMTQYQFYRRGIAEATEGLTTISIDRQLRGEGGERSDVDLLAEIAKEHKVPLAAQLGLLQRIRVVKHARNAPMRCRLFVIRCLALAVLPSVANDGTMQSRLFIYESDLIARLTDLIHPERGTDEKLRTASLYALESLSRLRSKASEVLTSVNVAVSHGILMQLVRKTVATLKDTSSERPSLVCQSSDLTYVCSARQRRGRRRSLRLSHLDPESSSTRRRLPRWRRHRPCPHRPHRSRTKGSLPARHTRRPVPRNGFLRFDQRRDGFLRRQWRTTLHLAHQGMSHTFTFMSDTLTPIIGAR